MYFKCFKEDRDSYDIVISDVLARELAFGNEIFFRRIESKRFKSDIVDSQIRRVVVLLFDDDVALAEFYCAFPNLDGSNAVFVVDPENRHDDIVVDIERDCFGRIVYLRFLTVV